MDNVERGKRGLPPAGWAVLGLGTALILFIVIGVASGAGQRPDTPPVAATTKTSIPPATSAETPDSLDEQLTRISQDLESRDNAAESEEAATPRTSVTDGTFEVGSSAGDIVPGTYRTSGGNDCYWARSSDTSGEVSAIIANGFAKGPTTVTISASDGGFETNGGCLWSRR